MYRVFDPSPILLSDCSLQFGEGVYHVVRGGKIISTGEVIEVDEDLMIMKHNPDKMMITLAKIRKLIRLHEIKELGEFLP